MTKIGKLPALTVLLYLLAPGSGQADCPAADSILEYLEEVELGSASRTTRFAVEPPTELYVKAAARPGEVATARDGLRATGVMMVALPVETMWMAINDEDHHAEGDYLPVRHSQVIGGDSRGRSRLLFQYFRKLGIGRWWIEQMDMDGELFQQSGEKLWELRWKDRMDSYGNTPPTEVSIDPKVPPLRETSGAWLLVPINAGCTSVEYFVRTDPGGLLSKAQLLMVRSVVRENLEGMTRLAVEHIRQAHRTSEFVRPDGRPLASSVALVENEE